LKKLRAEPYISRGAIGGAIGGLSAIVLAGLWWVYTGLTEGLSSLLIVGFALALMGGAVTGVAVGYIIWRVALKTGKNPHPLFRAAIGVAVVLVLGVLTNILNGGGRPLAFEFAYAIIVGALPGFLAHSAGAVGDDGAASGNVEGRA